MNALGGFGLGSKTMPKQKGHLLGCTAVYVLWQYGTFFSGSGVVLGLPDVRIQTMPINCVK
jgi:hypothetical protein